MIKKIRTCYFFNIFLKVIEDSSIRTENQDSNNELLPFFLNNCDDKKWSTNDSGSEKFFINERPNSLNRNEAYINLKINLLKLNSNLNSKLLWIPGYGLVRN